MLNEIGVKKRWRSLKELNVLSDLFDCAQEHRTLQSQNSYSACSFMNLGEDDFMFNFCYSVNHVFLCRYSLLVRGGQIPSAP